jgi:hypothetical protein
VGSVDRILLKENIQDIRESGYTDLTGLLLKGAKITRLGDKEFWSHIKVG